VQVRSLAHRVTVAGRAQAEAIDLWGSGLRANEGRHQAYHQQAVDNYVASAQAMLPDLTPGALVPWAMV
jgi:hypothetical protein